MIHEEIKLYKEALRHPEISFKAKRKGSYNLVVSELEYGLAVGKDIHKMTIFRKVGNIFFLHPILSMKNLFFKLVFIILGSKKYSIIYTLKNRLHSIVPYKTLTKLHR